MEESKLVISLDCQDEGPVVAFSRDKPKGRKSQPDLSVGTDLDLDLSQGHSSHRSFLPHSPSSPGSLADLSALPAGLLVTNSLVKSSSTDLDPSEGSSPQGRPLLSLVKSLSTEIPWRTEPEVNLSGSDSKLHLHPWKQHPRIPEARAEAGEAARRDDWAAAPSADPRGSSLMAELEGKRRKISEAMQDQLSMLSKMIGEESCSVSKQGRASSVGDAPAFQSSCEREGGEDPAIKCRRKPDGEPKGALEPPVKRPQQGSSTQIPLDGSRQRTYTHSGLRSAGPSQPLHWLFLVGLLAYSFFVLPLPPYLTGLLVGVMCGFMLGLGAMFTFAPRRSPAKTTRGPCKQLKLARPRGERADAESLAGWMNETHSYDPETFHPSIMHSVYVTLDGSRLSLAYPRTNVPRWAGFDEVHEASFQHSCTYELAKCRVSLMPRGLARKRLWNKKYPICITLADGEGEEESPAHIQEEEEGAQKEAGAKDQHLYLFGRTGREKEEWFQRFLAASRAQPSTGGEESPEVSCGADAAKEPSCGEPADLSGGTKARTELDYSTYMTELIESCSTVPSPGSSEKEGQGVHKMGHSEAEGLGGHPGADSSPDPGAEGFPEGHPLWLNSLVGRIFWDFLREKYWTDQVAQKIQKKLSKIKLPYFMNELTLADLDMGTCLPQVLGTSKPTLDHRGLWLELQVVYTGCLQMSLETKMNLCKLGKEAEDEAHSVLESQAVSSKPRLSALADSDEESSSAGSSDEDEGPPCETQGPGGDKTTSEGHTGLSTSRKILRFVDKIAKSKYFQKATENEYIRKKIAEVSNMPLMLTVEVLELSGTLAINIPPPPTDRIWYSFRLPPRLDLHVRPVLGDREVTFTHVTEWIEKKLQCEFQKVFVMPNMDDLYLPLMTSALDN
ncbi:unnamed protein product, partial [Tetraodon nigroviridis]